MIKFRKDNLIVLGLSEENMRRLPKEPIKFNLKDLDMGDVDVIIYCGKTEEQMYIDMLPHIDLNKTKLK